MHWDGKWHGTALTHQISEAKSDQYLERRLQQLIGHLKFACKGVAPDRAFLTL